MNQPIPTHRGHVPFVRLLLALSAGILTGQRVVPTQCLYHAAWSLLAIVSVSFVCVVWTTGLRQRRYYGLLGFQVLLAVFAIGCIATWRTDPKIDGRHFSNGDQKVLIGYVADEPVVRGGRVRFPLKVTQAYDGRGLLDVTGKLMLTLHVRDAESSPGFGYGDELMLPANYQRVPPPYNPGEMDYRRYLENKHIWHQSYLSSDEVSLIAIGKGNWLVGPARSLQKWLVAKFKRYITHADALSVVSTLVLGYRADVSDELRQVFSNTGTIHVLSVSGMHVVIVFWLMSHLLMWMDRNGKMRVVKFMIMVMSVWSYAAITGFSPSVLRASTMISFVIAASTFGQQNRIYNSVAASAFLLLLCDPKFMADIGFQLSYLAVLGIVFWGSQWQATFARSHRLIKVIGNYVGMSVSAQAGAGPMATYYFHQFPLYFLVANLFIVLPASGIMYLGFLLLALPHGTLAAFTGGILEKLILMMNAGLHHIAQLPVATIQGIEMTAWGCLLAYLFMFSVSLAWTNRSKRWTYVALVSLAIGALWSFAVSVQSVRSEIIIFNVRGNMAIGLIADGEAWVYSDLGTMDNQTFRYAVLPGLETHVPANRIHLIAQDSRYHAERLYVNERLLQFGDIRLMVYNGKKTYQGQLEVDVLLMRENPIISLAELVKSISCEQVVVDGSNDASTIERLKEEADTMGISFYILKDNFAYCRAVTD